jgi:hypothetical protein
MKLTVENRSTRRKTYPIATLSTTILTWTDRRSNPGIRGERPATNRLSRGTALFMTAFIATKFNHQLTETACDHGIDASCASTESNQ